MCQQLIISLQLLIMKTFTKLLLPLLILAMPLVRAQSTYVIAPSAEFTIKGTSNVHDWDETIQKATGNGSFSMNDDGSMNILSVQVTIQCIDIKSTHGSIMDNKTYEALKAEKNPTITYKLLSPVNNINPSTAGTSIAAKGQVTIAGVTKAIDLQVKVQSGPSGSLIFEGSKTLKMTDFGVSPPTAFMGAMKVGDEVVVKFKATMLPR